MEKEIADKIEEGLMPELGGKVIKICDKEFHITEMPVFYVKQLNRKLEPVYSLIAGHDNKITVGDLLNVNKIESFYDILIDIAFMILNRIDDTITKEWLEKNASEKVLIEIIKTQLEVNGLVNFLGDILRNLMGMMPSLKMNT